MKWFDPGAAPGWFDLVAFSIAVWAFIFAKDQLNKTKNAAERSADTINTARLRLNGDQLAAALPQFGSIVGDLNYAIIDLNANIAHRVLVRYSHVARETVAVLANLNQDHVELGLLLIDSAEKALDIKQLIMDKGFAKGLKAAKDIEVEIDRISSVITEIVAQNRYGLKEEKNV